MNGKEALQKVIEGIKSHVSQEHTAPEKIVLGWELAIDLCKLTRDEVGDLAAKTFTDGEKAFEESGLFGIPVEVDRNGFDDSVRVE
jgi:hypothetical protein